VRDEDAMSKGGSVRDDISDLGMIGRLVICETLGWDAVIVDIVSHDGKKVYDYW